MVVVVVVEDGVIEVDKVVEVVVVELEVVEIEVVVEVECEVFVDGLVLVVDNGVIEVEVEVVEAMFIIVEVVKITGSCPTVVVVKRTGS